MKKITASKEYRLRMALVQGAKPFNVYHKNTDEYVGTWVNKAECARDLEIDSRKVRACLNKSRKSHKGYKFEFKS